MNKISIIIPNYNGKSFLKECLDSIKNQNILNEIIIIDNASHDESVLFITQNYPEIILIQNKENLGFSKAVNQGIEASLGEYLFLLNNDVELEKDCIKNLIKCIDKNENIFAVSSKMIQYHDRNKIDDAGDEYTILGWTKKVGYGNPQEKYNKNRETFSACAGAAIYRKSILEEIGYFDENFFAYLEDIDLSYRARIHGYHIKYCPEAIAYHIGSGTTGSRYNEFKIKLAARNNFYVPYKNMPWPQLLINLPFLMLGYLIKYIFFLRKRHGHIYLKGLKEGIITRKKVGKLKYNRKNLINYFKIEWFLIKNTLKFPFF
ncbi:MAG: glycosyltransferase family 2 protein [Methanobacteriaceae archaeon]|nr:glycosyltransferase family 2 protein [Methanobacteriaceae archaeon]